MCDPSVDFQVTSGATALFPPESAMDKKDSILVRDTTHYCLYVDSVVLLVFV